MNADKPTISDEARGRMTAFIAAVEKLQQKFDVRLCSEDELVLRDARRTEQWVDQGALYGFWDATIYNTSEAPHSDECGELEFSEP